MCGCSPHSTAWPSCKEVSTVIKSFLKWSATQFPKAMEECFEFKKRLRITGLRGHRKVGKFLLRSSNLKYFHLKVIFILFKIEYFKLELLKINFKTNH